MSEARRRLPGLPAVGESPSDNHKKLDLEASPAFDLPTVATRRRYIVCSMQRTGSSLLCQALRDTGLAGQPRELLHAQMGRAFLNRLERKTTQFDELLDFIERHRTTSNGAFGIKVQFDQLGHIAKTEAAVQKFLKRFDVAILVHRRDKVLQAVSYERALQSQFWEAEKADVLQRARAKPVTYNAHAIAKHLFAFIEQEAKWRAMLKRSGLPVLLVAYEDLVGDFPGRMRRIAQFIGADGLGQVQFADPPHQRLSDAINDDWAARFLADIRGVKPAAA